MKIGILILFRNDETAIEVQKFVHLFAEKSKLSICFVNNGSTDKTLELLKEIQEDAMVPISIIDVKKDKGHSAAIKAGVRYLSSKKELPYILCLKRYKSQDFEMLEKMFQIIQQEKKIVTNLFKKTKCMVHKNVFSLHGILGEAS
ncbi:glycosyltransferase [Kordia sp. YSTF-M3]|uniref:Glycosyltransferase n=1 Tax=Kordia aestuariivivens TaxID=2759037 RepID=A0ABR7QEJ5_9FLAO|nr:glycosyltransferase [Kordia aestuariivivens]MBC8756991.1 glycosyltransferase [Kordia aestuariivivens]